MNMLVNKEKGSLQDVLKVRILRCGDYPRRLGQLNVNTMDLIRWSQDTGKEM